MIDALSHRGPDARGVWGGGPVAFGHRASFTTPESRRENQPLRHHTADLVIVADARIDNRAELSALLRLDGGAGATDVDLILAAYRQWGERCVRELAGDFAFAIWDGAARSLFCARDPMGVKPLYYVHSPRRFAFASEIKALFVLDDVSRDLDEEQVGLFLEARQEDRDRTLYRDVRRLPAAHTLTVSGRVTATARYWSLDDVRELRLGSDDEYVEAFRERFGEAVRCRLRSVRPVGATLSGGLDSSSVVCMSRRLLTEPLHTFSLVFPDLPPDELRLIDERPFMSAVVRGGGLEAHEVRGDHVSPLTDLARMFWHLDEPFFAPNLYLHWAMYGVAYEQGVGVLLDGFDGDVAVSHGLGRLDSLAAAGAWGEFEREVRGFAGHRAMSAEDVLPHYGLPRLAHLARRGRWMQWRRMASELSRRFSLSRKSVVVEYGLRPLVPSRVSSVWRSLRGRRDRSLLRPALRRRLDARRRADAQGTARIVSERESHVLGLSQPLYQSTLEMADKAAAAFGLEARYPFFDRRLVEFCVSLPEEQKFANGWSRYLFRRAMQDVLPPEIQWRGGKGNLSANFFRGFRLTDHTAVSETTLDVLTPYADMEMVKSLGKRLDRSPAGVDREEMMMLFRASVLARWLSSSSHVKGEQREQDSRAVSVVA